MYFDQIIVIIYSKTSKRSKIIYFWMLNFFAKKIVAFFLKQMPCAKKSNIYNIIWSKLTYIYKNRTNIRIKFI